MNSNFFIPLFALLINNITWGYVLAQKSKNRVNRAYILLSLAVSGWLTQNLIMWLPVGGLWYGILTYLNSAFWVPMGFLYLNFSFAAINKKRNFFYYLFLSITVITVILSLTTDLMGKGYEMRSWGPMPRSGILYYPALLLNLLIPFIYSLFIMSRNIRKTKDINRKHQLILIIIGTFIGLSVGMLTDVLLSHIFNLNHVVPLGSTGGAILSLFVFAAIIKYRFLAIDIVDIANDLFANVQDGIIILTGDAEIIQMNDAARDIFNLKENDLTKIRISTLIKNYAYQEDYVNFETTLSNKAARQSKVVSLSQSTSRFLNRAVGKILIIRDITAYNKALVDLNKHRNHLEELVRERTLELTKMNKQLLKEITERKQKELQLNLQEELLQTAISGLKESEERYRTLAENAFDLICEVSQQAVFMYVSPNYREVTGYDPEELIGQKVFSLIHPDDLQNFNAVFEKTFNQMTAVQSIHRHQHKNGDWLWFESAGKPYRAPDDSIRVVYILRDITNRKKIEAEMIKANKLESIGILAGGLAHDFNNILSILWGNISIAKMYNDRDQIHQRLNRAEMALVRARELTQQLLIFAKGVEPIKKVASLAALVSESVFFALRGSSIQCRFNPPEDLWLVEVDEGQLNQVFNNLIINAQQAMPDGGQIIIEAENIKITEEQALPILSGKYVKLSFTDNGIGIPEENLRKIFDPYFTTKPNGTGLGLATSYSIIKKHNGFISAESQLGNGTTIHIFLPASDTLQMPVKTLKPHLFKGQGRVLVMDDESELRAVLAGMLEQIGFDTVTAIDGQEAIQLYQQALQERNPFSYVIMDLLIPGGMDGKETIKHLLKIDPKIKAIVSSGYSQDPVMANCTEYGFCEVLRKPYTLEELIETFESVNNKK